MLPLAGCEDPGLLYSMNPNLGKATSLEARRRAGKVVGSGTQRSRLGSELYRPQHIFNLCSRQPPGAEREIRDRSVGVIKRGCQQAFRHLWETGSQARAERTWGELEGPPRPYLERSRVHLTLREIARRSREMMSTPPPTSRAALHALKVTH